MRVCEEVIVLHLSIGFSSEAKVADCYRHGNHHNHDNTDGNCSSDHTPIIAIFDLVGHRG